ncbi:MAG: ABC transporter ATP-binding protein, partial [Treponema sp.]|nr:ABC transporter ATP-binding protein [Treponema sp.]
MSDDRSRSPSSTGGRSGPMGGHHRRGGVGAPVEKAKDFSKTVKKLIQYLLPYKNTLLLVFSLAVLSTVFSIVGPKILGKATTKLIDGLMAYWLGTGLL